MRLLLLSLVLSSLFRSSASSSQYMRRHASHHTDHHAGTRTHRVASAGPTAEASPPESLVAGIASSGAITGEQTRTDAENQEIAASFEQFKQNFVDAQKLLAKAYKNDVYENGFEVNQVSKAQKAQDYREEKEDAAKDAAALEAIEKEESRKHQELVQKGDAGGLLQMANEKNARMEMETTSYNAMDAPRSGFWAKDRPNEERIDPNNMKIYTWRTYKIRFPFGHTWETEAMWKKLPLAPKKIRKVHTKSSSGKSGTQLLEEGSGTMLVDEESRELTWMQNSEGYFFQGHELPSKEEQFRKTHPKSWQRIQTQKANNAMILPTYRNYTDQLAKIEHQLNHSHAFTREAAAVELAGIIEDMETKMKLKAKTWGKSYVSVFGATGNIANFNADVSKVSGKSIKQKIQSVSGIPWETQRILYKGEELSNTALLNTVVAAGRSVRLSLHVINSNNAVSKGQQSKLPPAKTANTITDASKVLLEKQQLPADEQEQVLTLDSETEQDPAIKKRHTKSKHHHHGSRKTHKLENAENVAKKLATKELVDTNFEDDSALKASDDSDSDAGQNDDDADSWDFWGSTVDHLVGNAAPTEAQQDASYQATAKAVLENKETAQVEKEEPKLPEVTTTFPPQHTRLIARTVYVKDAEGKWVVEKTDAGAGTSHFDDPPDLGIPVEQRLQETSDEDQTMNEGSSSAVASTHALVQEDSDPRRHLTIAEERQRMKHALSEEMRWKLRMKEEDARERKRLKEKLIAMPAAHSAKALTTTMAPARKAVVGSLAEIASHA